MLEPTVGWSVNEAVTLPVMERDGWQEWAEWSKSFHFRDLDAFRKENPYFDDTGPEIWNGIVGVFEAKDGAYVELCADGRFVVNVGNFSGLFQSLEAAAATLWRHHAYHEWVATSKLTPDPEIEYPAAPITGRWSSKAPSTPTLTPFEALNILVTNNHKDFLADGFKYSSDGPQGSPKDAWFPIAVGEDGIAFYPNGPETEPITVDAKWVREE
jgi:hypothetical protein